MGGESFLFRHPKTLGEGQRHFNNVTSTTRFQIVLKVIKSSALLLKMVGKLQRILKVYKDPILVPRGYKTYNTELSRFGHRKKSVEPSHRISIE